MKSYPADGVVLLTDFLPPISIKSFSSSTRLLYGISPGFPNSRTMLRSKSSWRSTLTGTAFESPDGHEGA